MYEIQFIKIPKPFKKNVSTKKRYDLSEANRRYVKTIEAHEVEGERLEIDLLDVSTNEAYQFELYADLESNLLALIIKHLGESIGALDEKDVEKVEALKQKITDEFLIKEKEPEMLVEAFEGGSSASTLEIPEETMEEVLGQQEATQVPEASEEITPEIVPDQEPEMLIETSEDMMMEAPVFNKPEIEGSVDLSEYLDASDFVALQKLKRLQTKVNEKINWSPEELFGFFSFINSEELSPEKKNETLLSYDFSVDLKNLKVEIATLIDALEQQAKEALELRYHQSLEDTDALLEASKNSREKALAEQLHMDAKRHKSEVEQSFTIEMDQLQVQQEEEIQRLRRKHQNEVSNLETRQAAVLQTSCQDFTKEKMEEFEQLLDDHLKVELVNIQASQSEELQNYKKTLNQEQLNASSGRIERLQVGERKIVETLFNVLKFNVLKQEDPSFQEDYNPYAEQELPSLRNQNEPSFGQRVNEVPVRHHTPAFDQAASLEQERHLEELRLQNQLLESKLNTPSEATTSEEPTLSNANRSKKWWIGGSAVLLVGVGAAATFLLGQGGDPEEPNHTEQQPTTPLQAAQQPQQPNRGNGEDNFRNYLESGEYVNAIRNYPEHAPELISYLFDREDADNLREVLELGVIETLHGLLNLAILESQYETVVYEFERMSMEDRRGLNSRQIAGIQHAYSELGREPAEF